MRLLVSFMTNTVAEARKWGHSLALIIPKSVATELDIHEGDAVNVAFEKQERSLSELFGSAKSVLRDSTEDILRRSREGVESAWL